MKIKNLLKKWHLLAMMLVLLIGLIGMSVTPVSAGSPPPTLLTADVVVSSNLNPFPHGSLGSYMDISVNGGPALRGWCADEINSISIGHTYRAQIFDYFDRYWANHVLPPDIPARVATINWHAIAWIINNQAGTEEDVQKAIWHFTNGIAIPSTGPIADMVNGAIAHPTFVPDQDGQLKPVICFSDSERQGLVQIIFFEYKVHVPAPPLPELPAGVLLGLGLVGLGGFGWFGYRKNSAAAL